MNNQIFSGIRVLDFTQVISGSYGTSILGDMGAEIIKVEPPVRGDALRHSPPFYNGKESGFFLQHNRNKKSICVNLKKEEGIRIIKELIPCSDIIAQNFKPGVMEKLGLGYEDVRKIKEDIIYASLSGYGHNNRYSNQPAYDSIVQCESGVTAQNGFSTDDIPLRCPLSIADYASAMYSATAMVSALYHHQMTGKGQSIDVALYDSLISIMDNTFIMYDLMIKKPLNEKSDEEKKSHMEEIGLSNSGNRHPGISPHGIYKTKDGYFAYTSLSDKMWHILLKVINREDLIGHPKFEEVDNRRMNWQEIDKLIENWSTGRTTEEVLKIFHENKLPCGKYRTIDEVYEDPYNDERGVFHEIDDDKVGKIKITNIPIKFSETPTQINSTAPKLGEHNHEILMGLLNYSKEQVDNLLSNNVLYSSIEV